MKLAAQSNKSTPRYVEAYNIARGASLKMHTVANGLIHLVKDSWDRPKGSYIDSRRTVQPSRTHWWEPLVRSSWF